MASAPIPPHESERLEALVSYGLLDTDPDPAFDTYVKLASQLCDTPIALVSLVDADRQWFKANVGLPGVCETSRDIAFCSYALVAPDIFEVPDATLDSRFADNPLVTGEPFVRFYAGVPLVDRDGHVLGTLCAIDRRPRSLSETQRDGMRTLATSLVTLIEARKGVAKPTLERLSLLSGAVEHAPNPLAIIRVPDVGTKNTFLYVNGAFAKLFAYAPGELTGKSPQVLIGPRTDVTKMQNLREAVAAQRAASEFVCLYTAGGEPRTVELREQPIDGSHRIMSIRDLTDVTEVQDALATTNDRLRSLLANNTDAVLTIENSGTCADANKAAVELFGRPREQLLGTGFARAVGGAPFPADGDVVDHVRHGRTAEFDATYALLDGREIAVRCKVVPMAVRGVTEGTYLIVKDVTQERRLSLLLDAHARRTRALYLIAATSDTSDAEQIDNALRLVLDAFGMGFGYVGRVDGDSLVMRNVVGTAVHRVGSVLPLERTLVRETIAHGDALAIADLATAANRPDDFPPYDGWHAYVSAPLTCGGRPYGAIGFLSTSIAEFDEFDLDFVRLVAALVSSTIERMSQREQLDQLAYYDALTDLPNRAKFMRDLDAVVGQSRRHRRSFALHYIDLDGFKHINDSAGHAMGDLALKEVASRLRVTTRGYDVPARLGGDEFVLLQTELESDDDAATVGERIVSALSKEYALAGAHATFSMGASIGIAIFPKDGDDAQSLLHAADAALYRAKACGKSRIERATALVAPGRDAVRARKRTA